jgi:prepilin signal peptidase PulO-like enzyme (type II secretory pathway)
MVGAVCAAMALQWTVARAVGMGVMLERVPFLRTAKGGNSRRGPDFPAFWEAVIGALLLIGSITLVATNYKQVREINIFALVLVVQSLPFVAAVALAAIEGTRFNSFVYWRELQGKVASLAAKLATRTTALLPQRRAISEVIADPPKLPADTVEPVQ